MFCKFMMAFHTFIQIFMKDIKYLFAYSGPVLMFLGILWGGWWSYAFIIEAFVLLPLLELVLPVYTENTAPEDEEKRSNLFLFDLLLYLHLPIVLGMVWFYFSTINATPLATYELVGLTIGMGIFLGTFGINIAHELGHRSNWYELLMARLLLLPNFYMHFTDEHNLGHHKNVATPVDPSTSRYGEMIYVFLFRSIFGVYREAWQLENRRLHREGLSSFHWKNKMLWFQIIQLAYLVAVGLIFSWTVVLFALAIGIGGIILLESVNYIEHYGLRRKQLPSGRYEPVQPFHSWNSGHSMGRIFLFELTRHSDHHFKANRKYQILRHFEESPQLPTGYPGSIILALFPPLWFSIMNKRLPQPNH